MMKSRKAFINILIGVSLIFCAGFANFCVAETFQDPVTVTPTVTPVVTEIPTPTVTPTSRPTPTATTTATPTKTLTVSTGGSISFTIQGNSDSQATLSATVGDNDSNGSITITSGSSKGIGILLLIWILSLIF